MDVSGGSRSGTIRDGTLLPVAGLTRGRPTVIVLQAEPADDEVAGTGRHHDLADKLRLATALMDDAVPGVLILPELPASLASEVARVVNAFADAPSPAGEYIQAGLLRPLRELIARRAKPAVLDDVILFLNARSS